MAAPLSQAPRDVGAWVVSQVQHATLTVEKQLRRESPVLSGTFKRAWRSVFFRSRLLGLVINPMPYGVRLAEQGWSKKNPPGMNPWVSQSLPKIVKLLEASRMPPGTSLVGS